MLRNGNQGFSLQSVEEGLIYRQSYLRGSGFGQIFLRPGAIFRTGEQVVGASKIGNELADGNTGGRAWKNYGIVQAARRYAAVVVSIHGGNAQVGVGKKRGPGFTNGLLRDERLQFADGDLRIIFQRDGFGFAKGQRAARA